MGRCTNTSSLRLLHRITGDGAKMQNVKIYCTSCYQLLIGKSNPDENIEDVSADVRERALKRAGYRCECTSGKGCH